MSELGTITVWEVDQNGSSRFRQVPSDKKAPGGTASWGSGWYTKNPVTGEWDVEYSYNFDSSD